MRAHRTIPLTFLVSMTLVACSGASESPGDEAAGGSASGEVGGAPGTGGAPGSGSGGAPASEDAVPTSSAELFAYLQAGGYRSLLAESAPHPSAGPHGGSVRTYITPGLAASLEAGQQEHPVHAAAVKELYLRGTTVAGWAVMVKTQPASDGGDGWYYYEIYSATDPSRPVADGPGVGLCAGCHSAGRDFVLSPFPLQ
jgi:hypothetical protein